MGGEEGFEGVGVDFEGDGVVGAAGEEAADVELGEAGDAELAVLLDMDEFVEEKGGGEGLMGHDEVAKGDGSHEGEVGEIVEAEGAEGGVEGGIGDAFGLQDNEARGFE